MTPLKCPGQDKRFWKPEDIFECPCPKCKDKVEFWKDDLYRRCKKCGHRFRNPKLDLGCAEWCKFAKECLGPEIMHKKQALKKKGEKDG